MLNYIDHLIDEITMYRLVLYVLIGIEVAALILSFSGIIHYTPEAIIVQALVLFAACWGINKILAAIFQVPTNIESSLITALILALIIPPFITTKTDFSFMLAAAGLAMGSKYVLSYRAKHIFNPAAIAMVLMALGPKQAANWWVGATAMLPAVIIGGLLITRKIHRGKTVLIFFVSALLATALYTFIGHGQLFTTIDRTLTTSAMFFLGFVMLTEPLTMPATNWGRNSYAALVGILFPPTFHILSFYTTPEIALVLGNAYSFLISSKTRFFPTLVRKVRLTPNIFDFAFAPNQNVSFKPGQYMEWALPHEQTDSRGNRRYFTIASSPTENELHIGVKFYEKGSSFKHSLFSIGPRDYLSAVSIAGDFVLPKDQNRKLAFIAAGIGVTPYRSMIKYLIDTKQQRDIHLLYSVRTSADLAYKQIFEAGKGVGLKTTYFITSEAGDKDLKDAHYGRITKNSLVKAVPDYMERLFYISGTQPMVKAIKQQLLELGIPRRQIKIDYFSGYSS